MSESEKNGQGMSSRLSGYRRDVARREPGMKRRILEALGDTAMSVPGVAGALDLPASEVMWWMMGLVRYGEIVPAGQTDESGYRMYRLPRRGES